MDNSTETSNIVFNDIPSNMSQWSKEKPLQPTACTPESFAAKRVHTYGPYNIYVVTWNVGSRFPDNISLRTLLGLQSMTQETIDNAYMKCENILPDIYAIGLQEVNSQPQQQVLGLFKDDPWTEKAKEILKDFDYVLIKTEQMQGLLLSMFVRREHILYLRDIEAEFTRTGFGGIWGNKGAVSIRFTLYGCGFTFVATHLAAHDHHLDERVEDYKQILENHHYHVSEYREIFDHDYIFWFGDLNFRLQGNDSAVDVRDAIFQDDQLPVLIQRDQLLYVREKTHEAFNLLSERLPAFPPTFKFKEGTSEYDMKRRPAWTDRILYAVQPLNKRQPNELAIEQKSYKSHPAYTISDHKPVTSEFLVKFLPSTELNAVKFSTIDTWILGEEKTIEYLKTADFVERDHDWIGIYPKNYISLRSYVAYEYVNQTETPPSSDSPKDPYFDTPSTHRRGRHHHQNHQRLRRLKQNDAGELIRIDFSDDIELKPYVDYRLIYFQNTGLRGVMSVSGMSNIFRAVKRSSSSDEIANLNQLSRLELHEE